MIWRGDRSDLSGSPSRERGLALLVVLWIVVAAALVVSAFNAAVKSGVSFVASEVQLARMDALLDAGAEIAATRLIDENETRRWSADAVPHTVTFAGSTISISIADGNARIDLNKADKELLMGLLRQFAPSEATATALRDRILLARGNTPKAPAGAAQYRQDRDAGAPAEEQASEAPAFVDIAQLRGLEGMSAELYAAIAPFLTVYSASGRISALAAPNAVLLSIPQLVSGDAEKLRAAVRMLANRDMATPDVVLRAEPYLAEKPGPAFVVTVSVLQRDGNPGASGVYVLVPGLDAQAPYRLIAKRPAPLAVPGGAS